MSQYEMQGYRVDLEQAGQPDDDDDSHDQLLIHL